MARLKRVSRLTNYVAPAVTLDRDRRRDRRGPAVRPAQIAVLTGLCAGDDHEVLIRDSSPTGSSFYLKTPLPVGSRVKVTEIIDDRPQRVYEGEITRTRPISNGRHEMSIRYSVRVDKPEIMKVLA